MSRYRRYGAFSHWSERKREQTGRRLANPAPFVEFAKLLGEDYRVAPLDLKELIRQERRTAFAVCDAFRVEPTLIVHDELHAHG